MGETRTPTTQWRRSSYSGGDNNCVEVAPSGSDITVRDSKNPGGGTLSLGPREWRTFMDNVRGNLTASDLST
jgi:Domain of unknown function (DUF397)